MASPTQITVSQLYSLIGTPQCPILIDVCIDEDFATDPHLIPGAFRYPYCDIEMLVPKLQDHKVIIICQKGLKLSEGTAALLRFHGIAAQNLKGGNIAWRMSHKPMVPAKKLPECNKNGHTVWVAPQMPDIECTACLWLLRRFIDRDAQVLFVEPSQVENVAEKFDASPLHISARPKASFAVTLAEFELETKALLKMANIISSLAENQDILVPEAVGLSELFAGLSILHENDLARLEAVVTIFDGLYCWAQDTIKGTDNEYA